MTSPLLFSVCGCESCLHLFLPPSFVLLFRRPLDLLHLQLLAPRDEEGWGGISYRYMCCYPMLILYSYNTGSWFSVTVRAREFGWTGRFPRQAHRDGCPCAQPNIPSVLVKVRSGLGHTTESSAVQAIAYWTLRDGI